MINIKEKRKNGKDKLLEESLINKFHKKNLTQKWILYNLKN